MCSKYFVDETHISLKSYLVFLLGMLLIFFFYIHGTRANQHNPANILSSQTYLHSSKPFTSTESVNAGIFVNTTHHFQCLDAFLLS